MQATSSRAPGEVIGKRVFVAAAFTPALSDRGFDPDTRSRVQHVLDVVRDSGSHCFSSHLAEAWGDELEGQQELAHRDVRELQSCTHFVVYIGRIPSVGIFIELGAAIELRRPVLALFEEGHEPGSDFYLGLVKGGYLQSVAWTDEDSVRQVLMRFISVSPPGESISEGAVQRRPRRWQARPG